MRVLIYLVGSMRYTPFSDFEKGDLTFLNSKDIYVTSDPNKADVFVSQNIKHLVIFFWRGLLGKRFLIWTTEPRFNTSFKKKKRLLGFIRIDFMNIYNKNVFVNNTSIHAKIILDSLNKVDLDTLQVKSRKIVALMSHYQGENAPELIYENQNIDLIALRTKIVFEGYSKGLLEIYGKGWPKGMVKENSRDGDWVNSKKIILKDYRFNLCFENTAFYNYMTEKIWDSISNYCLPIYFSKNTNIYKLFPKDSFVDYNQFESIEAMFSFIESMSNDEYIKRINKCIDVYNSISRQNPDYHKNQRKSVLNSIVETLK